MTFKSVFQRMFHGLEKLGGEVFGSALGLIFVEEIVDGKKRRKLNYDSIRSGAPHFAKSHKDEAEFEGLVIKVVPTTLLKRLARWMSLLGRHQRADIMLTICEMIARTKMALTEEELRTDAVEALRQLAAIPTDAERTQRAVAFHLMKANETDYWGSTLNAQAQAALVAAIAEVRQGKADWDIWMRDLAADIWIHRQELEQDRTARQLVKTNGSRWQRMVQAHRRATAFPWERN